jgi:hypothetical protein
VAPPLGTMLRASCRIPATRLFFTVPFDSELDYIVTSQQCCSRSYFLSPVPAQSKLFRITWLLSSALTLFALGNIWIQASIGTKFSGLRGAPNWITEPPNNVWFLKFALVAILGVLLILAQIFLLRDPRVSLMRKCSSTFFSLSALLVCLFGFVFTATESSIDSTLRSSKTHTVTLSWEASKSKVDGYNVYRSFSAAGPFERINKDMVRGLSFVDHDVKTKTTYYYVTRAVDKNGRESVNSNVASADVP